MGAHRNKVNTAPDYTGSQLQTSAMSLPVPLAWGLCRGAPNLIWMDDFTVKTKKVGKGGVTGKTKETTYSASIIEALCEGPIGTVTKTYINQGFKTGFSAAGFELFTGTTPQAPWSYLVTAHPSAALGYQGIAYLAAAHFDLGTSEAIPSLSFEGQWPLYRTGVGGAASGADPGLLVQDFLTNVQYGANFPTARLDLASLLSGPDAATTGDSAYQTYCQAMGFDLSPFIQNQEAGASILARWLQITNTAPVWTGYSLMFVPHGDETVTANGVTYVPPTAPAFDFGDDDYLQDGDADPIEMTVADWFDAWNRIAIECSIREYDYNAVPIDWIDQRGTELLGPRQGPTISAHEICETAMATRVVSLIGARLVNLRNTYTARLGPAHAIRLPMEVGFITDAKAGIDALPVRIVSIEEADDASLTFVFEEFPATVGAPTTATSGGPTATPINSQVAPDPVNPPLIFELNSAATAFLTGSAAPVVFAAVSGGAAGVADPNWGGCNVFVSTDGATYAPIGTMTGPSRMGVLTASLAAYGGANPDAGHTLKVSLLESAGTLQSASSGATAAAGATLAYVDGELIGPQTANLTGTSAYDLTGLYRGLFGTSAGSHSSGTGFARLDNAVFAYQLPAAYIGATLHFKFQSFNIWGQGVEDLAGCTAYTFTPAGAGFGGGTAGVPTTPTGVTASAAGAGIEVAWAANPATDNVTAYRVSRAAGTGASFGSASLVATVAGTTWTDAGVTSGAGYTYFVQAQNAVGVSAASAGANGTASASGAGPVVLGFQRATAAVTLSDVFASWRIGPAYTVPAGLTGSELSLVGVGAVAPSADVVFDVQVGGVSIGSATIAAGAFTGVFAAAAAQAVASGVLAAWIAPASLHGMSGLLTGSMGGNR